MPIRFRCCPKVFGLILCVSFAAAECSAATSATQAVNLVANGDFSSVSGNTVEFWQTSGNPRDVEQKLTVEKDANGRPYAKLVCTRCEPKTGYSHAMLCQVAQVKLIKGTIYEFTCRMKAEGLASKTVGVAISDTKDWSSTGFHTQLTVGRNWKEYRAVFTASHDVSASSRLQIWYTEPGDLCVADVRLAQCAVKDIEYRDVVPDAGGTNLVPNPSFELGGEGWSSLGQGTGWGDLARLHGRIVTEDGAGGALHGKSFLRVELGDDKTPVLYFDYLEPVVRREIRPLAASRGWIRVEKGATYTLSCAMRSSVEGARATLGVRTRSPADPYGRDQKQAVTLRRQWKTHTYTFRPQADYLFVYAGPDLAQEVRVDVDIDAVQLEKGDKASPFEPRKTLEVAIEPSVAGALFTEDQPVQVTLRALNTAPQAAGITIRVTDFWDREVLSRELEPVPPGQSREVPLPVPGGRGSYLVVAWDQTGKRPLAQLRYAVVPRPAVKDGVCGINHAFAPSFLVQQAAKAGVTWYRDWSLKWQHIEPGRGQFRWEIGDAQINRVLDEGVNLMALLPPFPSSNWASEAPEAMPATGYPGVRLRQAWAPRDPSMLAAFVQQAAARYKGRVDVLEFLNEPIYTNYALPGRDDQYQKKYGARRYSYGDYVDLLKTAAAAMKKGNPACRVIGGIGGDPREGTREIIEAGILNHLDVLNLHIYPNQRLPETFAGEMESLLKLMDANGGRKPIWITEFSYYGADNLPRRPFFPIGSDWAEERLLESERQCADLTIRFFLVMLSHGVEKVFIHSGASGKVNDPSFECCLFDYGGAPRKIVPALATLNALLGPRPQFVGWKRIGQAGRCHAFETATGAVLALWSDDEDCQEKMALPAQQYVDLMGAVVKLGRGQQVVLTSSPIYIVADKGRAKELLGACR